MSMLTPRGAAAPSAGPPRNGAGGRVIAVLVTLLVFGAVGLGAWWYLLRPTPPVVGAKACPTPGVSARPAPVAKAPTPRSVRLNVYNGTQRRGLAAAVASLLRARGFVVVKVANDPLGRNVTGVAEIRHSARGAAGARVVSAHVGAVVDVPDTRRDASVDVVLGSGYARLRTPAQAAAALRARPAATPLPSC